MCRAHQSIRRRPIRVSIEFQQALQESVLVTLQRRATARLAKAEALSDEQAAEAVIAALLCTDQPAHGMGSMTDPILNQLGGTAHTVFVRRRED